MNEGQKVTIEVVTTHRLDDPEAERLASVVESEVPAAKSVAVTARAVVLSGGDDE